MSDLPTPAAIFVTFSDSGENIRKWSREPFEGALIFILSDPPAECDLHPEEMSPVQLAEALGKAAMDICGSPLEEAAPVAALMSAAAIALRDLYALGLMVEECGELAQIIGKWLRFGPDRAGPEGATARQLLPVEAGDASAAIDWAGLDGLFTFASVIGCREEKKKRLLDPESRDDKGLRLAPPPRGQLR